MGILFYLVTPVPSFVTAMVGKPSFIYEFDMNKIKEVKMKKLFRCWLSIVFVAAVAAVSFAQANKEVTVSAKYETIESNYLTGLNSANHGLKVSSAYFLGDMKSHKAVIPLMKMFRNEKNDGAKLVAAWSLLKIGDARGVFLVKRESELGNCDGIRCMLGQLYQDYCLKTNGKVD